MSHADQPEMTIDAPGTVSPRRRVLAATSLVLGPVGFAMVLYGFLHGLPQLLGAMLVLVAAGGCVWEGLGHRSVARWTWLGIAGALVVLGAVLVWASGREVVWILIGLVVAVAGGSAAGSALLHAPRRGGRRTLRRSGRVPRTPVLFVNPWSGGGTAERVGLAAAARDRGIRVVELGEGDDLSALARRSIADGADCLGAAGGDGTLALVAGVAIDADVPFVCVPAGTRNHFALDLGLDRQDPIGALDAFGESYKKRIDVAEVNGRLFLNNVSVGAYGEVVADEQYRERKIGTALAKLPQLIGPDSEQLDLRFTDGDGLAHDSAIVVHVSNNAYELAPRPGFGTRPSLSDGLLGVVAVVHGAGLAAPVRVIRWETPTLTLQSAAPIAAGLDGEAVELEPPARFSIRPGALRLRIPTHAMGVSPAARRPRISRRTVDHLWALSTGRVPAG